MAEEMCVEEGEETERLLPVLRFNPNSVTQNVQLGSDRSMSEIQFYFSLCKERRERLEDRRRGRGVKGKEGCMLKQRKESSEKRWPQLFNATAALQTELARWLFSPSSMHNRAR